MHKVTDWELAGAYSNNTEGGAGYTMVGLHEQHYQSACMNNITN